MRSDRDRLEDTRGMRSVASIRAVGSTFGHATIVMAYFLTGIVAVFTFTLAIFFSLDDYVSGSGLTIFQSLPPYGPNLLWASIALVCLAFAARHNYYSRSWIRWTKVGFVAGGSIGLVLAFLLLLLFAVISSIASDV